MKALRSNKTGHIMGWNRNIWKTGVCTLIDLGDKPTPQRVLDDIENATGTRVTDGPGIQLDPETGDLPKNAGSVETVETATAVDPSPRTVQLAPEDDTPPVAETAPAEAPAEVPAAPDAGDTGEELDLDSLDVDNL